MTKIQLKGSHLDTIESALLVVLIFLSYALKFFLFPLTKIFPSSIMFCDDSYLSTSQQGTLCLFDGLPC